jgi:hypothetical protein
LDLFQGDRDFLGKVIVRRNSGDQSTNGKSASKSRPKPPGKLRVVKQTIAPSSNSKSVTPAKVKVEGVSSRKNSGELITSPALDELKLTNASPQPSPSTPKSASKTSSVEDLNEASKLAQLEKFTKVLEDSSDVDLVKMRKLCWHSIPAKFRPVFWPMLLVSFRESLQGF